MKKKFTILALFIIASITAQEKESKFNLGVKGQAGTISTFGLEAEYIPNFESKYFKSLLMSVNTSAMKIDTDYGSTTGTGFEIGVGRRNYLNKKSLLKGLYIDSYINYGSIKFDDKLSYNNASFEIDGKFKYVSIMNASLGYKLMLKRFLVEPSVSVRYNIEIKGEGFIDNKDIDNFLFNAGLRIGYSF